MHGQKIAVLIGDGRTAEECARIIAAHAGVSLGMILHHDEGESAWSSRIENVGGDLDVPRMMVGNVNEGEATRALKDIAPDIVFSANNWDILGREILDIPADGVINFHNGPLPEYRGVNTPSWAIFNGETRYGVSWHYAADRVDTGDLLATTSFDLADDETAISLIFRCIDAGIGLLPGLLDRYVAGTLNPVPQQGKGACYYASDIPNDGYLDFTMSFERLSALVRALTFRPFPSPLGWPRMRVGKGTLPVTAIEREGRPVPAERWTPGEIRDISKRGLLVCAADGLVRVGVLEDAKSEKPLDPANAARHGLAVGTVLHRP